MRYDRGSATPLAAAIVALVAVATLVLGDVVASLRERQLARTAAEALAIAVLLDADLNVLVRQHSVDSYSVEHHEATVTVVVTRDGVTAEASALDHRRTLEPFE